MPGAPFDLSEARYFAVFRQDYLVVPKGQAGIRSRTDDTAFLKALAVFLSSDFAFYHQFLSAPQFGVKRDVATLAALRSVPFPIVDYTREQLKPWVRLHERLVRTTPIDVREIRQEGRTKERGLFDHDDQELGSLLRELNALVYDALGLDDRERALVSDFVNVRFELNDGKMGQPAVRPPRVERVGEVRSLAQVGA